MKEYILLKDLEVYKLARALSEAAWKTYEKLDWQDKKIMGDQFIESVDSVGANIAEGYKRYHYLDKVKFYYNARASLSESCAHWLELLFERRKVSDKDFKEMKDLEIKLSIKLNNFIKTTCNAKNNKFQQDS
jgi:four helix bundle protein